VLCAGKTDATPQQTRATATGGIGKQVVATKALFGFALHALANKATVCQSGLTYSIRGILNEWMD